MAANIPVEEILKRYESDVFGHKGFLSFESDFFPQTKLPSSLPKDWIIWEQYMEQVPQWYREGKICEKLLTLPILDPENIPDDHLVRANIILGNFALGFMFCWEQMGEKERFCHASLKNQIKDRNDLHKLIRPQILDPWEQIWRRMGRHRSCFESDMFVANFKQNDPNYQGSRKVSAENSRLMIPFFASRTEHRFWFSVLELCARFPGISSTVRLQKAMLKKDYSEIAKVLYELADIWFGIVEEVLTSADTRISAMDWANTTARWTSALFEGEEGFSGMFAPAWHIMDILIGRTDYSSFLGQVMIHTRTMLPVSWQEYIRAVDSMPLREFVESHKEEAPEILAGYEALLRAYHYFFPSHRRKVYAFEYQAMMSGRAATNGGIVSKEGCPGWDMVNNHLIQSASERPCPHARMKQQIPIQKKFACLIELPISRSGWFPGDRARINVLDENNEQKTLFVNLAPSLAEKDHLLFWSTEFKNPLCVQAYTKIPGEFFRPSKSSAQSLIIADSSCAGLAASIAREEAHFPAVWIETEGNFENEIKELFTDAVSIELIKCIKRKMISNMQQMINLNESGGHIYICGNAEFVKKAMLGLRENMGQQTLFIDSMMRKWREEKRLHLTVQHQTVSKALSKRNFYPWDIATATNPDRLLRVILHGKVLNLTDFINIHLGGENIIEMLAGTDISKEFESAHPGGVQLLGITEVYTEGQYIAPPEQFVPLVNVLYKVVRYVNAFVVTQKDVRLNSEKDMFICANTLLYALEIWPVETLWGKELFETLGISLFDAKHMTEFCNQVHLGVIEKLKEFKLSDERMEDFYYHHADIISVYEMFGRSLIGALASFIQQAYEKNDISDALKNHFINTFNEISFLNYSGLKNRVIKNSVIAQHEPAFQKTEAVKKCPFS